MKLHLIKKPVFLILALFFAGFYAKAQNPTYNQLVSIISAKVPALNISDKIIAFTAWSATDAQSREMNKEFERVGIIYQGAKLKNGTKGAVLISYCFDDASTATIAFKRDGISYAIRVKKSEFQFLNGISAAGNIVYDNTTAKVYENIARERIFLSINELIIR